MFMTIILPMFLSIRAYADKIKRSKTRVFQLLQARRIPGAQQMSANRWLIPENAKVRPPKGRRNAAAAK